MGTEYRAEFQGVSLEDSYFLGLLVEGRDLRLKMGFALTVHHPAYAPPNPGGQHCYREGSILIERPDIVEWHTGMLELASRPDGTFDVGGLELYQHGPGRFRIMTDWFDAIVETPRMSIHLS